MGKSTSATGSKRSSLRFRMKEQSVSYKTAYEDGQALLANISTGGCAVSSPTVPVEVGEKLLLSFDIPGLEKSLEMRAVCVRLVRDGFAVRFLGIDTAESNRIIKLLAGLVRSEKE